MVTLAIIEGMPDQTNHEPTAKSVTLFHFGYVCISGLSLRVLASIILDTRLYTNVHTADAYIEQQLTIIRLNANVIKHVLYLQLFHKESHPFASEWTRVIGIFV